MSLLKSLIHFELIFVYGVLEASSFILLHVDIWFSIYFFLLYIFDFFGIN